MMKMTTNVAAWLQFHLYLITLSGYSADSFMCAKPGELNDDPKYRWQFAVDIIYRGIRCGLMDVWDGANKSRGTKQYSLALVKELAINDPNSDSFPICWVGPEIEATELCETLVKKYNISTFAKGVVRKPFIAEIDMLFERHDVSWSKSPLIEIETGAVRFFSEM
jgi:hypothetical protein